jgi:serine/threonine-protein kinase
VEHGEGVALPRDDEAVTPEPAARWKQVKELFAMALEKAPPLRAAFLAEACGEDAALRSEVETLLSAHRDAGAFFDSVPAHDEHASQIPSGTRVGPYEIVDLIGAGGMGQVYRARDARLGREVAIKVLPSSGHREQALQRFAVEARAAGSISHPNILAVYDVGTYEGGPYLVFELLKGQTLRAVLGGRPLPLGKALDLAVQLAQGLSAAHDHGIVHRDLKPENLFVTSEGRLKILDFGIARLVAEGAVAEHFATLTGSVIGTVGYMSPEQVRGERADHRSDLFAFGLILHEMLTGELAFKRESAAETGNAILNEEPPKLPENVPPELARLVRRCLEKKPQDRFQSAHDITARLASIIPAPATPTSILAELKHRRVFRALLAYGLAAFAILQIIEPIMHGLRWPDSVLSYVVVALALGFPVVVALAWIFDVKAGRVERTAPLGGLRQARIAALLIGLGLLAAAPGLGWYFLWRSRERPASAPTGPAVQLTAAPPSIAVLAFADMSPQKDQEYFSDGIAEEILNELAHVEGLHVSGRTSSFSFKGKNEDIRSIGQKLNVAHVLEGSVRRSGSRFRITAQIITVSDGYHLWSQTFDRELTDIFAVQDEIARAVVSALKMKLLPTPDHGARERPTTNIEAYNQYLLGRRFFHVLSNDGRSRAIEAYEKALELDPGYAPAWAGLATAVLERGIRGDSYAELEEARKRAPAAAEKAVALDPAISDGYLARGRVRVDNWDWVAGQADLEHALALNGGDAEILLAYAILLNKLGRLPEAIRILEKAIALDPLSALSWANLSVMHASSGKLDLARSALNRTLEMAPELGNGVLYRGQLSLLEGQPAAALASFRLASKVGLIGKKRLWGMALAEHDLGRPRASQRALDELIALGPDAPAYMIAVIYAWRGERDPAFGWLERAYEKRDYWLSWVKFDPFLRNLHGDPRYTALLKKMHLPVQ